ncbi:hypothetical protein Tco_1007676, partial [Tanacetum coccineum]
GYFDEVQEDDENNHSNGNVVKRGITRLYKFHRGYGKPDGIKLSVTFDALNRISGKHRALFSSFLGDMVCEHIGLKILFWKKVDSEARDVGNKGFKTVKDAVGGFFVWPKDQVVFDPKATPLSTIQMNVENKTAPKLQTKSKNVYVSSDAMQRQDKKKCLQRSLNY